MKTIRQFKKKHLVKHDKEERKYLHSSVPTTHPVSFFFQEQGSTHYCTKTLKKKASKGRQKHAGVQNCTVNSGKDIGCVQPFKNRTYSQAMSKHHKSGCQMEMYVKSKSLEVQLVFHMGVQKTIKIELLPTIWPIKSPWRRESS